MLWCSHSSVIIVVKNVFLAADGWARTIISRWILRFFIVKPRNISADLSHFSTTASAPDHPFTYHTYRTIPARGSGGGGRIFVRFVVRQSNDVTATKTTKPGPFRVPKMRSLYDETVHQAKVFYYRNSISHHPHIQNVGKNTTHQLSHKMKRPISIIS